MKQEVANSDDAQSGFSLQRLVDDLEPVQPVRLRDGLAIAVAVMLMAAVSINLVLGIRSDVVAGNPHPVFLMRSAILLLLGFITGYAALSTARPEITEEQEHWGRNLWKWALGAAVLFPLMAIGQILLDLPTTLFEAEILLNPAYGRECLLYSGLAASAIALAMTLWLRRGAVVVPERSALLIGLSAGTFGAAAYNIHCPFNSLVYNGIWFSLAVVMSAIVGRLLLPRFLRW